MSERCDIMIKNSKLSLDETGYQNKNNNTRTNKSSNSNNSSNNTDKSPKDFEPGSPEQTEQIIQTGSVITSHNKYTIYCLTIIGQIEGHYILSPQNKTTKYEHVIPQLVAIEEESKIDGLLILLNTVGGDVEAGLAIAELVAGMKKPTVSMVIGGGHSIGVPLAVAANKSFIAESATMTIHPVRMNGLMLGVPQTFEYFQRMQERITNFVTQNSNISANRFYELAMNTSELVMDIGTVLDGKDAVEEGLIDYLGNLSDALSCLYAIIDENKSNQNNDITNKETINNENTKEKKKNNKKSKKK